jgi:hypothetical protein
MQVPRRSPLSDSNTSQVRNMNLLGLGRPQSCRPGLLRSSSRQLGRMERPGRKERRRRPGQVQSSSRQLGRMEQQPAQKRRPSCCRCTQPVVPRLRERRRRGRTRQSSTSFLLICWGIEKFRGVNVRWYENEDCLLVFVNERTTEVN